MRGDAKREAIVRAAIDVFLQTGYLGTSVDDIAAAARASKRTVYSHFGDKEGLFREVIRSTIAPMQAALQQQLDLTRGGDPWESLRAVTRSLAGIVVTPNVVRLRRVLSAEVDRFPDLADEWYRLGPAQTVDHLADWLAASGLPVGDPRTAAEQLHWLVISTPLNRLMFAPSGEAARPDELDRAASTAFDLFRLAYGPARLNPPATSPRTKETDDVVPGVSRHHRAEDRPHPAGTPRQGEGARLRGRRGKGR
jgi:TetR/AcrR family transcriptional regulator, mexJK operon transcriptional repressor